MYKQCKRCVMDTDSGKSIIFDENGYCNYCNTALVEIKNNSRLREENGNGLEKIINELKEYGKDKEYDCLMGISGGLDSSYLLYMGNKWGLRILALHLDDGFYSDLAKENIRNLVAACENVTMLTIVPDEEQANDLYRAALLAGVPNACMPQDGILFSNIYRFAVEKNIKYFLYGGNLSMESIYEKDITYINHDIDNLKDINRLFGTKPMDKLRLMSLKELDILQTIHQFKHVFPLNYIDYKKEKVMNELNEFCGYRYYGEKHYENLFTKFYYVYYLYNKFGVDGRKSFLSSLVLSNQMTRQEALDILSNPPYVDSEYSYELDYVLKKLDLSREKLEMIIGEPPKIHEIYKTSPYVNLRTKFVKIKSMSARYDNGSYFIELLENAKQEKINKLSVDLRNRFESVNRALLAEVIEHCSQDGIGVHDLIREAEQLKLSDVLSENIIDNKHTLNVSFLTTTASSINENIHNYYFNRIFKCLNSMNRPMQMGRILFICNVDRQDTGSTRFKLLKKLSDNGAINLIYSGDGEAYAHEDDLFFKVDKITEDFLFYIGLVVILDHVKGIDYGFLCKKSHYILDTVNALNDVYNRGNIELL